MDDMDVAEQIAHLHHHGLSDQEIWGSLGIEPDELVRLALNLMSKSIIASTSKQNVFVCDNLCLTRFSPSTLAQPGGDGPLGESVMGGEARTKMTERDGSTSIMRAAYGTNTGEGCSHGTTREHGETHGI